jgi:hypothetical protein
VEQGEDGRDEGAGWKMSWFRSIYRVLQSRTLTLWCVGLAIIYYLTVAVWAEEAFATFMQRLSHDNIFRVVYVVFCLNVTLRIFTSLSEFRYEKIRFLLKAPLSLGLVIFLLSLFLSLNVREQKWQLVGEGDVIDLDWEEALFEVSRIDPALKKDTLRTDDSGIFDYEPRVFLKDNRRKKYTAGAFPPEKMRSTYMHILNFGIGPGVELKENDRILFSRYYALQLMPFGALDSFEIPSVPYRFFIRILPNKVIKKGDITARNYNIERPLYEVEIVEGDRMIQKETTDGSLRFADTFEMTFLKPSYWVLLEMVYDPFYKGFVVGLFMIPIGGLLYLVSLVIPRRKR